MRSPLALVRRYLRLPQRVGDLERRVQKVARTAERKAAGAREQNDRLKRELKALRKLIEEAETRQTRRSERVEEAARRQIKRMGRLCRRIEQINSGQTFNAAYAHLGYRPRLNAGFNSHEFAVYSQNGEDGLLLHIFDTIGMAGRRFVEISPGDAIECNSMNLVANFGWSGLMVDASEANMATARALLDTLLGEEAGHVTTKAAFVTAENVSALIAEAGMSGEIDLLSIDVDGIDYWLWRAIGEISPRVVVIEYNELLGRDSLTVSYDPAFRRHAGGRPRFYFGASLTALARLGRAKGYCLLGSESSATNLFFLRSDLMRPPLAEQAPESLVDGTARRLVPAIGPSALAELPFAQIGEDGEPL